MKNKRPYKLILPILILSTWIVVGELQLVKPLYLPPLSKVISAILDIKADLFHHSLISLLRLIWGYILGVILGFGIGIAMKANWRVDALLYGTIESFRPVPAVALVPFFVLWFGFSTFGKVLLVVLGVALIVVVSTYEAINNIKPVYIKSAYALGASKKKIIKTIIIPAIIPELRSGLRIALAIGFGLVLVSEFMGADYGLGYLINISKTTFSTHTILLCVLIIGVISSVCDFLIQLFINSLTDWVPRIDEI